MKDEYSFLKDKHKNQISFPKKMSMIPLIKLIIPKKILNGNVNM